MANVKLFYSNLVKTTPAILTASSSATGYPATNLYQDNYAEVWRSTAAGAGAETVVADFGSAVSISAVALGNINIRSSATVKIQGHTADSWATPDVDQTINVSQMLGVRRNLYHDLTSGPFSKRYWRISILDNGNPDGFIEVGEWFLGVPVTLTDNAEAEVPRRILRSNVELRTEYLQAYVYARDYGRQFDLTWKAVTKVGTIDQLEAMSIAVNGNQVPFFYVFDPTVPAEAYYVRISGDLEDTRILYNRYDARMQFTEEMPGLIVPK